MNIEEKILDRAALSVLCDQKRARGEQIVFTNGCFDVLHAGHVELLHAARARGDFLVVGLNSDASVRRLKGTSRPVNEQAARALVLAAMQDVGAVCVFEEDTPVVLIEVVCPHVHVKGGDYRPDDLPEAATVRALGGEVVIVPLRAGLSTTRTLEKLRATTADADTATNSGADADEQPTTASAEGASTQDTSTSGAATSGAATEKSSAATPCQANDARCVLVIPARFGATRFPGKPLQLLGGRPVIEHVVRAALRSQAGQPVLVATDDTRIAKAIVENFAPHQAQAMMTRSDWSTGTERIAEAIETRFADLLQSGERLVIVNVQGDEPFIEPRHIDLLIAAMRDDPALPMATLATPLRDPAQHGDPNVVKAVLDKNGGALYFSRLPIPFMRDGAAEGQPPRLRHLGIYAYSAAWLLQMARLPPSPLEEIEKLEQLRALENGARIKVVVVENIVNIAIDTPHDLQQAEAHLRRTAL